MEARVNTPKAEHRAQLSTQASLDLSELDKKVESEGRELWFRAYMLEQLHEDTTRLFVNSPGFGVGRMLMPYEQGLQRLSWRRDGPPEQPRTRPLELRSPETGGSPITLLSASDLFAMHTEGVLDFVNPRGFGLVKDRQRVVGFQSHSFSRVPSSPEWKIETVELVGLLIHSEPVVYVSTRLPAMDQLRDAATRPLNEFEVAGLAAIRGGDDIHSADVGEQMRMFGSLRNGQQCVRCHGGEFGDLLGAFSYSLVGPTRGRP
jgi:hypothetical protein